MKPTDTDRAPAFDRLIARGLERETDAAGNACPDADLLAAWFDRSLSALETERVEAHAAGCACCQQILADLARSEPEVTRAAPLPVPARPWHWHWRWLVPLATAAVVIVVGTRTVRAPGPVSMRGVPAPALGERPSTWVELRRQAPPSGGPGMATGAGGALQDAPSKSRGQAPPPAETRSAPRKEGELAKAPTQALDRLSELKRESVPAGRKPSPVGANADAPRSPVAAGSMVTAAPPPPASAAAADKALSGRPAAITENVTVAAPAPPAAAPSVAQKRALIARESSVPLLSTSVSGPAGATATWRYGQGGVIERSTDRGQTWERQASGVTTALVDGSAPSDRVCWVVGARGVVLRQTDGRTWERLASPTQADLVSVHAWSDTNATITASDQSEYVTVDGGMTWRRR